MGLFDGITGAVQNIVRNPMRTVVNPMSPHTDVIDSVLPGAGSAINPIGRMKEDFFGVGNQEQSQFPGAPEMDPQLLALQREQIRQAEDFKKAAPGMKERAFGIMTGKERQRLADDVAGVKTGMNRRGLLYSGMTEGLKGRAKAESVGRLAEGRANISQQIDDRADALRQSAMGTGIGIQQINQQVQNQIYQQALSDRAQRSSMFSNVLGAVGLGAGTAMGRKG